MPVYEYKCTACKKKFSLKMAVSDMEKGKPKCPKCGSRKTEKLIGGFFAVTSKKS
ncbi:MAG: zinc ribbon domain-containing protein [Candidatus Abyssobacteria bacterium SURF_17]|uniref:Zinc ribbon domain-containing protein n=1 Tax=Candidatus Abyssobacteria bacterium SURF_17 TaxID=2093361 RepID=A0A419F845_9BACT|nr:MAG: zinc ribbon domain-containing protein [Candidatus Abyssubacteria bacterium SURF_17]